MTAELISVGTEILLGNIVNTNAAYLSEELALLGVNVYCQTTVGDNDKRLMKFFKEAFKRSDIVILGGGLGPTEDDLTKETVCKALEIGLVEDKKAKSNMESILTGLGYVPSENNYKQAMVPEDAIVMYNNNGTAPGMIIEKNGHTAILLPGPPNEMIPMFKEYVVPYIKSKTTEVLHSVTIKECGIGESLLETMLLDLIDVQTNPTIATYAKTGCSEVRITAKAFSLKEAKELIKPVKKEIIKRLGDAVYTTKAEENLEEAVVKLLKKHGLTLATAESCTGGLVASKIVNVPGASEVFENGFVTYSNKAKHKMLNVSKNTLKEYTAVSKETAKEMAIGCKKAAKSDVAVAVTGYAGPDDTPKEPKGLVYIACAIKEKIVVREFKLNGNRDKIRENAAIRALNLVRCEISAEYK